MEAPKNIGSPLKEEKEKRETPPLIVLLNKLYGYSNNWLDVSNPTIEYGLFPNQYFPVWALIMPLIKSKGMMKYFLILDNEFFRYYIVIIINELYQI